MFPSFNTVKRIVHGCGCVNELGEEVKRVGGSRVLVVTDPGIEAAGILSRVVAVLDGAGLAHTTFCGVEPDPKIEVAGASIDKAKSFRPDVVVGVGGGSSLDISKVTSIMLTNEGLVADYFGMELVPSPGIPLILLPTTAGTGSEVTSICVLSDTANGVKKGIVSQHMAARAVMLDPELTYGLPPRITAMTGMDALVHAIESYTGIRATVFTDTLNLQAIRMIAANLFAAFDKGDRTARENMLYASCIAGMAFSNTQNGLVHALALAIGGKYHLPHGLLTAFLCPWVMQYNLPAAQKKYADIARAFGKNTDGLPEGQAAGAGVEAVRDLVERLDISCKLSTYNISRDDFHALAKSTLGASRLIDNNPRRVTEGEVIKLLEENY